MKLYCLHVKDYGQGVPKDIEMKYLKPFYYEKNGTGVGLSLKNIVEKILMRN